MKFRELLLVVIAWLWLCVMLCLGLLGIAFLFRLVFL